MVNVLWGLTAMKVDQSQCTAADVLAQFREAMQLEDGKHQVDVYRLVPVDPSSEVAAEETLMVHLPCSPFDCKAIEETYQQLQDAEIRNERCQESVMALAEALRVSEMSVGPQRTEDVQRLQQENSALRNQLDLSERARQNSARKAQSNEECTQEFARHFGEHRHDLQQRPVSFTQSPPGIPGDGHVAPCPAPGPMPFPNSCLHITGCGSAPVTPRMPRQAPRYPPAAAPYAMPPHPMAPHPMASQTMSAAVPSGGRSVASMAQNHFGRESRTIEMQQMAFMQPFVQPYVPVQQIVPGRKVTKGGNTFGRR